MWLHSSCQIPFLSSSQCLFQLVCQFSQIGAGWGFQGGSLSSSPKTWGLHKGWRPRSVLQQLSALFRSLVGGLAYDYLCKWTPDIYTREHLFQSWVMRGEGGVDWTSQGDTRLPSCWIFCIRVQHRESLSILMDFSCWAKKNQTRVSIFHHTFATWNEFQWGLRIC